MGSTPFVLSAHAATVITEREIELTWIERVLAMPEQGMRDPCDPTLMHALARIPERGDRVLRVIYNHSNDPPRVVTAYFDRRQRGQA